MSRRQGTVSGTDTRCDTGALLNKAAGRGGGGGVFGSVAVTFTSRFTHSAEIRPRQLAKVHAGAIDDDAKLSVSQLMVTVIIETQQKKPQRYAP